MIDARLAILLPSNQPMHPTPLGVDRIGAILNGRLSENNIPFRASGGSGDVIAGSSFLSLIYVLPDRWGKRIGGMMLDAIIEEANRRGCRRIYLWTHERQNERAHRLYRSRG